MQENDFAFVIHDDGGREVDVVATENGVAPFFGVIDIRVEDAFAFHDFDVRVGGYFDGLCLWVDGVVIEVEGDAIELTSLLVSRKLGDGGGIADDDALCGLVGSPGGDEQAIGKLFVGEGGLEFYRGFESDQLTRGVMESFLFCHFR